VQRVIGLGYYRVHDGNNQNKTLVEAWDGSAWSVTASPNYRKRGLTFVAGVSCASDTSCFVVGASGSR
jgi:hypothetical protein